MNYRPLGSRLLVKILTKQKVKLGSTEIVIARKENHREWSDECLWAEVISIGESVSEDIDKGMVVVIGGAAGKWVDRDLTDGSATHRIIDEDEVLAIDEEMTASLARGQEAMTHA